MTLQARVGNFNAPGSGGTNVTGLGFRPGAIFLWTENATADNTWSNGLDVSYGLWCRPRPTLAARAQSAWVHSAHAAGSANASAGLNATRPISNAGWTVASIVERVDNDGFTVSYASGPPSGTRIHYLALGTDALAQIATVNLPAGLAVGSIVQVRGIGFTPTALLAIAQSLASQTQKTLGFGVAGSAGGQWATAGSSLHNADPMNTDRAWSEDSIINLVGSGGTSLGTLKLVGYVADGFNLQVTSTVTAATTLYIMALGNVLAKATVQAKPVGAAPAAQVINPGFNPKAAIFGGAFLTAAGFATEHRAFVGASDGTRNQAGTWQDQDAAATSVSKGYAGTTVAALRADNTTPTVTASTGAVFSSTGVSLSWSPNDAVAGRFGMLAIGNLKHSLGGDVAILIEPQVSVFIQPAILLGTVDIPIEVTGAIAPINLLGGDSDVAIEADGWLALGHRLGGDADVIIDPTNYLALQHTLGGDVDMPIEADSFIWISTPLGGDVDVTIEPESYLALHHTLGGDVNIPITAEAYFTFVLPEIRPPVPNLELAGTVNMHPNPGAEDGLSGWIISGASEVAEELVNVWEGVRSVAVTPAGVTAGEGFAIQSVAGTDLTGLERTIWGSVYVAGPSTLTLKAWTRARYTNGTYNDGDILTGIIPTPDPDWQRIVPPSVLTDPTKKLAWVETHVVTETVSGETFYADGAQVEEDRGQGATYWTSGTYGAPTGVWSGVPNRSASVRYPLPMQKTAVGYGGHYEIEASLWRMTWDNQQVEDISDAIVEGVVSADPDREITWAFDATLTRAGWQRLQANLDWVAPFLKVTHADGHVDYGQLGLYLVVPSREDREEHRGYVKLSCYDPLWLVSKQELSGNLVARPGPDKARVMRTLLDGAVLTGGNIHGSNGVPETNPAAAKRYFVPDVGHDFKRPREWDKEDNRLVITNNIAKGAGLFQMFTRSTGFMNTRKRGGKRLQQREPVHIWTANIPKDTSAIPRNMEWLVDVPPVNNVYGKIPTTPKALDLYDGVLIFNDDPELGKRIHVRGRLRGRNGKHPRVVYQNNGRRRVKKISVPYLDDEATALELAEVLSDELSAKTEYTTIEVVPVPGKEFIHETVATGIWDNLGDPVVVGHWKVGRINYKMWPHTPKMTLELSRIPWGEDDVDIETILDVDVA